MAENRDTFFYSSKKVDVVVEPGAWEQLPSNMKEAILQRSKDKAEDPTIRMLKEQLNDPKLPPFFKKDLEETLNLLEQQKVNSNTENSFTKKL
jgi:hypothetical protein